MSPSPSACEKIRSVYEQIKNIVGPKNVSMNEYDLFCYSRDWSVLSAYEAYEPDIICLPGSTEEVAEILKLANEVNVPVVAWGGGAGLGGGSLAVNGGIMIDLCRMDKIIEINEENLSVTAEAGITIDALDKALKKKNLRIPHIWGGRFVATLGSTISTNAMATSSAKYGTIGSMVLGLKVVLPNGEVIKTGGKTPLTSPIYLSNLFIGSCGTLGIITEATIKVCRVPDHRSVDIIIFEKLGDAINVAYEVLNQGLSPESLIIDDGIRFKAYRDKISYLRDKEKTKEIGPDIGAVVISFTGSREVVKTCRDLAINIMKNKGGKLVPQEVTKAWWDTKHTLNYNPFSTAHKAIRIGTYFDSTVPVDKILELRRKFNERCEKYGFDNGGLRIFMPNLVNCFQVGVNDLDEKSIKLHRKFRDEHIKTALELGGTAITFLGLGEGRVEFLRLEYGETTYNFMKRLKKVLDPKNILNPGKLF